MMIAECTAHKLWISRWPSSENNIPCGSVEEIEDFYPFLMIMSMPIQYWFDGPFKLLHGVLICSDWWSSTQVHAAHSKTNQSSGSQPLRKQQSNEQRREDTCQSTLCQSLEVLQKGIPRPCILTVMGASASIKYIICPGRLSNFTYWCREAQGGHCTSLAMLRDTSLLLDCVSAPNPLKSWWILLWNTKVSPEAISLPPFPGQSPVMLAFGYSVSAQRSDSLETMQSQRKV